MRTLTLADGRTITLRPLYVDDELAIEELGEAGEALDADPDGTATARRYFAMLRKVRAIIDGATVSASWEGGSGQMSRDELLGLISRWREASEDDALPPDSGTSSETP